ncbi:MAG TPA: hypothetical protein VLR88_06130 [Propionibacteriaceae bacterium]|nr:hypothetical protein [Propionibacteriaceae bacterium]
MRLGLIGTAIFDSAGDPIDLETLSGCLEREFGSAPDGETLAATQEAVRDLVARSVLTIEPDAELAPVPGLRQPDQVATPDR